jgi:hypothetical protein
MATTKQKAGWEREIVELHEFFARWMGGAIKAGKVADREFARYQSVMGADFLHIGPDGRRSGRRELDQAIASARAARRGLKIRIADMRMRFESLSLLVATYEEWQVIDGEERGRLSTVVFRKRRDLPNGVEWYHVHEVWLHQS